MFTGLIEEIGVVLRVERLAVAESLFAEDYARIPASRGFRTWWKDNLDSPVVNEWLLWPCEEMLAAFRAGGSGYHAARAIVKDVSGGRDR